MEIDLEFINLAEKIIFYEGKNQKVTKNNTVDKFLLKRVATKTAIMSVKFALKTIIGIRTVSNRWGTRPIPSVCVMSLSQEQIFQGKTPETLVSFFREPRTALLPRKPLLE